VGISGALSDRAYSIVVQAPGISQNIDLFTKQIFEDGLAVLELCLALSLVDGGEVWVRKGMRPECDPGLVELQDLFSREGR